MDQPNKLHYETRPRRRPLVELPPDWRRRLVLALLAGSVVFVLTFEAARRSQSPRLIYNASHSAPARISVLQRELNQYLLTSPQTPATILDVPAIKDLGGRNNFYTVDAWGRQFQVTQAAGKLIIISYGRDGLRGGSGLDADIIETTTFVGERLPLRDYLNQTEVTELFALCGLAAIVTAVMTFCPTREHTKLPVAMILIMALLTGAVAVFVGGFMAALEVPTGH